MLSREYTCIVCGGRYWISDEMDTCTCSDECEEIQRRREAAREEASQERVLWPEMDQECEGEELDE